MRKDFTQKYLNECLNYEPTTGILTWKLRPLSHFSDKRSCNKWNTRYANTKAGYESKVKTSSTLTYWRLSLDNHPYDAHIIIWIMLYGYKPTLVDHIDGIGTNNKKDNLRETTVALNVRKGKIQSNNSSGIKGVSYRKDTNKWTVRLKVKDIYKSFGSYDDKDYASMVYSTAVTIITNENFTGVSTFVNGSEDYNMVLQIVKSV